MYILNVIKSFRVSHNDRCVKAFVDEMNRYGQLLGMKDSYFRNPSGLETDVNLSTANDCCRLLLACFKNAVLKQCAWGEETYTARIRGFYPRTYRVVSTYKGKVASSLGPNYEVVVGKTGTDAVGTRNVSLVVKSKIDGQLLYGTVLKSQPKDRFIPARQLFDNIEKRRNGLNHIDCAVQADAVSGGVLSEETLKDEGEQFLFSHNGDKQMVPMSIIKLMTAYVAVHYIGLDEEILFNKKYDTTVPGNKTTPLHTGDLIKLRDAIPLMLIPSTNVIANCIARVAGERILFNKEIK